MDRPHLVWILHAVLSLVSNFDFSLGVQTLTDGQVLVSPFQAFEFGFFSPGTSNNRFLGIWYKATPDVVVWVANAQTPITGLSGVLTLSKNGSLILTSAQGTIAWSSTPSMAASSPVLELLDTGNLVVVEKKMNIWESFDYPGNTRLPGMKMVDDSDSGLDKHLTSWKSPDDPSAGDFVYRLENVGLPQTIIVMGSRKICRTGPWNGLFFTGIPFIRGQNTLETETVFNKSRLVSLADPPNLPYIMRSKLDSSGSLQRYVMNEQSWILLYSLPQETCDKYGVCGPNSICRSGRTPMCECLRGSEPKSQKQWSGCTRILPVDCTREDGFLSFERLKFPDPLSFQLNASMAADECRHECLRNCSCTAYADPYMSNETTGCFMWFGDLIDVKELIGDVITGPSIYIRVAVSEPGPDQKGRKGPTKIVYIASAASFGMLVLCLAFGGVILRMRWERQASKKKREELELPLFSLATIAAATNNFSNENLIGRGGFGPVYKGNLSAEQVIAVKRMSRTSGQGPTEFKNEVILMAKLQHRNLVRILGCCIEGEEKMLIYEYMHNKSLDYFIYDQSKSALLNWPKRFDIIMGIARGLLYLHHDSRLKIIHRDLKLSNILLDKNLNAKISDFGLARMFEGDQTAASTKRVVGTYGYMAPEYVFDGKFSVQSDVYSLGVIILEIVGGKKNRGFKHPYQNLLEQAWLLWKEQRELELMDPCYMSWYVEWQVKRCIQVALLCVQSEADERPLMPSVVLMLSTEGAVLPHPQKPGFFLHSSSGSSHNNASATGDSRSGSISISEVEAR